MQTQGEKLKPFKTSNPEHVFEIHPVTRLDDISVTDSWRAIEGLKTKDAATAFHRYESTRSKIIPGKNAAILATIWLFALSSWFSGATMLGVNHAR